VCRFCADRLSSIDSKGVRRIRTPRSAVNDDTASSTTTALQSKTDCYDCQPSERSLLDLGVDRCVPCSYVLTVRSFIHGMK
jgi:hypothetical protein